MKWYKSCWRFACTSRPVRIIYCFWLPWDQLLISRNWKAKYAMETSFSYWDSSIVTVLSVSGFCCFFVGLNLFSCWAHLLILYSAVQGWKVAFVYFVGWLFFRVLLDYFDALDVPCVEKPGCITFVTIKELSLQKLTIVGFSDEIWLEPLRPLLS